MQGGFDQGSSDGCISHIRPDLQFSVLGTHALFTNLFFLERKQYDPEYIHKASTFITIFVARGCRQSTSLSPRGQ